jgi:hypothetical protein
MNSVNRNWNIKFPIHIHTLFSSYIKIERGNGVNHNRAEAWAVMFLPGPGRCAKPIQGYRRLLCQPFYQAHRGSSG